MEAINNLNRYFTSFEATEQPPIVTKELQEIENNYKRFKYNEPSIFTGVSFNNIVPDTEEQLEFEPYKLIIELWKPKEEKKETKFNDRADYTKTMYNHIYKALQNNNINPDIWAPILTALTALESGWGNEFARKNNNYGGIKGKGSGTVGTKEWSPQKGYYDIKSEFKKYDSIEEFADDFVKLLKNRFHAFIGTPKDYVRNIRSKGYFTAKLEDYQNTFNSVLKTVNKYLNE